MSEPPGEAPHGIRPFLRSPVAPVSPARPAVPSAAARGTPDHLRPYILTSGRVQGDNPAINLETQVTAWPAAPPEAVGSLPSELRAIIAACATPVSVAEISARVHLHLPVTKILVGDLFASGFLDVHQPEADPVNSPDVILRVIHELRAIC